MRKSNSFTLIEFMGVVAVLAVLAAMLIPQITRIAERNRKQIEAESHTNESVTPAPDPDSHGPSVIYKTNYIVVNGLEQDDFPKDMPAGYALLRVNDLWAFRDGDGMIHPFWSDDGWKTQEDAIRAAWVSHTRRLRLMNGRVKFPDYTEIDGNKLTINIHTNK